MNDDVHETCNFVLAEWIPAYSKERMDAGGNRQHYPDDNQAIWVCQCGLWQTIRYADFNDLDYGGFPIDVSNKIDEIHAPNTSKGNHYE